MPSPAGHTAAGAGSAAAIAINADIVEDDVRDAVRTVDRRPTPYTRAVKEQAIRATRPNHPEDDMALYRTAEPTTPGPSAMAELPLHRLHLMRAGYAVMGLGLAVFRWPLLVNHPEPWPLYEGVVTCILTAMSLLALLGLRYPVRLLPILLFESAWKLLWLSVVAAPKLAAGTLDPATREVAVTCLMVVIIVAVVPWRYVWRQYVTAKGDRWG